jgi:hypothetical protein
MLSSAEIARGSQGAVKFLSRDVTAPFHFDNTFESCLRSFQVMILTAPIYAFIRVIAYMEVSVAADLEMVVFAEALRFVVDWLLFPVLFYEIARRRGWLERYPRYIAALNWINLPAVVLLLVGESVSEIAPSTVAVLLQIGLQILFFYWFVMATRMALGVSRSGEEIAIEVGARSFLHNQVRILVGTLQLVGRGQWRKSDVEEALAARDRTRAGPTAPPHGLCLVEVRYDRSGRREADAEEAVDDE